MSKIEEIEERLDALEKSMDAVIDVLNRLIEDVFEPEFVQKIDKLAKYEQEKESHKEVG